MQDIKNYFKFAELQTTYKAEFLAGATTFASICYVILLMPVMLDGNGLSRTENLTATCLVAAVGTLLMGFLVKRPFVIAPYVGEAAFIGFSLVKGMGYSWKHSLAAVFVSGILLLLLTFFKVRTWLLESIPMSLKFSFPVGIGLFLCLLGFKQAGLITPGAMGLQIGNLTDSRVVLSLLTLSVALLLATKKVKAAILLSIVFTTICALKLGYVKLSSQLVSLPKVNFGLVQQVTRLPLTPEFWLPKNIPVFLIIFVMALTDTMGTLVGLSAKAKLLDTNGNLPEIRKPMFVDSLTSSCSAMLGNVTTGVYMESSAGIDAGGRSGFTCVVVASLFALSVFFSPVLAIIPPQAYGPALVVIGLMMLESIRHINFDDEIEFFSAILSVLLMVFTFNIGLGMAAGFISYSLLSLLCGRDKQVHPGMWILALISLLFFVFYPY